MIREEHTFLTNEQALELAKRLTCYVEQLEPYRAPGPKRGWRKALMRRST